MESELVTNLRRLMDEQKISGIALGKKIGMSPAVVNKILDGTSKSPRYSTLSAIARALKVSVEQLTGDTGQSQSQSQSMGAQRGLHVRWQAEAGNWRESDIDQSEPETFNAPTSERRRDVTRFLARVGGDSMNRAGINDGELVVCLDWIELDEPLQDGQIVLVQQSRDGGHMIETTVKQIRLFRDRYELHPRSTNPVHKPIMVPHGDGETDGREIRILGLVEGSYRPVRTDFD